MFNRGVIHEVISSRQVRLVVEEIFFCPWFEVTVNYLDGSLVKKEFCSKASLYMIV